MMIVDLFRIISKPLFALKLSPTSTTHFIHSVSQSPLTLIMSTTAISTLGFPANSLLSLASQTVRLLNAHFNQQYETALTAGDDYEVESVENLTDVQITLQQLDPVYWKELADKRLQSTGGFTSWTPAELARSAEPQARMRALLELGRIPKAFWVMPEAVKLWRESRGTGVDGTEIESEDAQLGFLIFLSEKQERARLFEFVTANGHA